MAEILWQLFLDHLIGLDGVERRDIRTLEVFFKAAAKELKRRSTSSSAQLVADVMEREREDSLHKQMVDATAAICSSRTVRTMKTTLRSYLNALCFPPVKDSELVSAPRLIAEGSRPLFSTLVELAGSGVSLHMGVYPGEVVLEPQVALVGPYIRNPNGRRSVDHSVMQHMITTDYAKRLMQWSDHKVENIHSGKGALLSRVTKVHRRRLVFIVSADHAKPFGSRAEASPRFPWHMVRDGTHSQHILRHSDHQSQAASSLAALAEPTSNGEPSRETGGQSREDLFVSVLVKESHQIRVAASVDEYTAQSLIGTLKASLVQLEKATQLEHEKEQQPTSTTSTAEASLPVSSSNVTSPSTPLNQSTDSSPKEAHMFQVVMLVDVDSPTVTEHTLHVIRAYVLPKLKALRQAGSVSRKNKGGCFSSIAFDFTAHIVFTGKKVLQLSLPVPGENVRDPTNASAHTAVTSADQLQAAIKEFPTMVALLAPSEVLLPLAVCDDVRCGEAPVDVILSFQRDASDTKVDSNAAQHSSRGNAAILLHFPGGDRAIDRHLVQLLFQMWSVSYESFAHTTDGPTTSSSLADPQPSKECDEKRLYRLGLHRQFSDYAEGLHELRYRLAILSRIALPLQMIDDDDPCDTGDRHVSVFQDEMAVVAEYDRSTRTAASQSSSVLEVIFSDVVSVVFRATIRYPMLSVPTTYPTVALPIAERLVGSCTALTLLASLFASFGINAVVYEDYGVRATTKEEDPHHTRLITSIVLGFSPMGDVSNFSKVFVEECLYAPFSRQLQFLESTYWPLLIRLRTEAVSHVQRASIDVAFKTKGRKAAVKPSVVAAKKKRRGVSSSVNDTNALREIFVVSAGEDEDAETLERADKNGELAHALAMPIARIFLIPTPLLLTAMVAAARERDDDSNDTTSQVSSAAAAGGSRSSSLRRTTAEKPLTEPFVDDAAFLLPHVYQPEDADALSRITQEFATFLDDNRRAIMQTPGADSVIAASLLPMLTVRVCPAAVLHGERLHDLRADEDDDEPQVFGTGPLLPCVEVFLNYACGPYLGDCDESLLAVGGNSKLTSLLFAPAGALGLAMSNWILASAAATLDASADVAKVQEEALVHAIKSAERVLAGEDMRQLQYDATQSNGTDGVDGATSIGHTSHPVASDESDEDLTLETSSNAKQPEEVQTSSSWWWWWGSSAAAANSGGGAADAGGERGIRFSLASTKLAMRRPQGNR